jgi:hypothetical protein
VASSEQLKALIKSHISRDDGHFLSVAMQVAAHEAKLGHGKLAEELREMIDAAKSRIGQDATGKLVAIGSAAKPRGELANLLTVSHPANRMVDMVLDEVASNQLQRDQGAWALTAPQAIACGSAGYRQDHDRCRISGRTWHPALPGPA